MNELNLEGRQVRRSFDRAAASYDQAAALQRRVADRLLGSLAGSPARILDAGSGTGYGTAALAQRFPGAALFALDLAPGMLQATRMRTPGVPLVCADVQSLPLAAASLDLFWSSLMLQWCNRTDLAFAEAQRSLCSGGQFVFSTFGPATLHELRDEMTTLGSVAGPNLSELGDEVGRALGLPPLVGPFLFSGAAFAASTLLVAALLRLPRPGELEADASVADFRRLYGVDDGRFLASYLDVT